MYVTAAQSLTSPDAVGFIGLALLLAVVIGGAMAAFVGLLKAKIVAGQEDELRQLVRRYEHLSENILDVQQRVAADMSELRTRTASVEQILRSVE
jgi:phosphate/sulfate permease